MWDDDPESWNWEYSKVVTGAYTWCYTSTGGGSYIFDTQAQLVFDRDDEELVYIVADLGVPGEDTFEDGSHDYGSQWSQDIFIFRSEDKGQSWWNPLNVSNTPSYIGDQYPLEEQYPHAFQWGMNEEVYFMYQMPNWNWNELGDPEGADYMNYVYVGKASFTEDNQPSYPWENCSDPQYVDGDLKAAYTDYTLAGTQLTMISAPATGKTVSAGQVNKRYFNNPSDIYQQFTFGTDANYLISPDGYFIKRENKTVSGLQSGADYDTYDESGLVGTSTWQSAV